MGFILLTTQSAYMEQVKACLHSQRGRETSDGITKLCVFPNTAKGKISCTKIHVCPGPYQRESDYDCNSTRENWPVKVLD